MKLTALGAWAGDAASINWRKRGCRPVVPDSASGVGGRPGQGGDGGGEHARALVCLQRWQVRAYHGCMDRQVSTRELISGFRLATPTY